MTDVSGVDATNTLLSSPVDAPDEASICRDLLSEAGGDSLVGVAVTRTADQWIREFSDRLPPQPPSIELIDVGADVRSAAAESIELPSSPTDVTIHPVSSPGNLTDLGVTVTEVFDDIEGAGVAERAMCFGDLSALAQHHDQQSLFQFLEVLTSMCDARGVEAHYHVHPGTVDAKTINAWKLLADAVVTVDERGEVSVQTRDH